jgi:hypothetical protein
MKHRLIAAILIVLLFSAGCTDEKGARRVLQQNGYTNITITGYRPFMGSEDDQYSTGFTAISPSGQRVSGSVCSGVLKGSTIRFD